MLHPNMGSPRDAATLGEIGSAFPATPVLPQQSIFRIVFLCPPSMGGKVQYPPPPVVQPRGFNHSCEHHQNLLPSLCFWREFLTVQTAGTR